MTEEEKMVSRINSWPQIMDSVFEDHAKDLAEFGQIQNRLVADVRTAMHNLAIISGALATGALVLLSSDVPVSKEPVVIGILLLFLNIAAIYIYLFRKLNQEGSSFNENRNRVLGNSAALIIEYEKLKNTQIGPAEFEKKLIDYAHSRKNEAILNNTNLLQESAQEEILDRIFQALLLLSFIAIGLGVLKPLL